MTVEKQDDQHEHTFSSYVRIRDVVQKTYQGRWTIGRSCKRGSGISVLPALYDDDDDDDIYIYFLLLGKKASKYSSINSKTRTYEDIIHLIWTSVIRIILWKLNLMSWYVEPVSLRQNWSSIRISTEHRSLFQLSSQMWQLEWDALKAVKIKTNSHNNIQNY